MGVSHLSYLQLTYVKDTKIIFYNIKIFLKYSNHFQNLEKYRRQKRVTTTNWQTKIQ